MWHKGTNSGRKRICPTMVGILTPVVFQGSFPSFPSSLYLFLKIFVLEASLFNGDHRAKVRATCASIMHAHKWIFKVVSSLVCLNLQINVK